MGNPRYNLGEHLVLGDTSVPDCSGQRNPPVSQELSTSAKQLRSHRFCMRTDPFANLGSKTLPHFQEAGQSSGKGWR